PPPTSNDSSKWGMQTLTISGGATHQEIPAGGSITFTRRKSDNEEAAKSRSRSRGRNQKAGAIRSAEDNWDLLLATHSAEATGVLLVYRIPIIERSAGSEATYSFSADHIRPIQRQY